MGVEVVEVVVRASREKREREGERERTRDREMRWRGEFGEGGLAPGIE